MILALAVLQFRLVYLEGSITTTPYNFFDYFAPLGGGFEIPDEEMFNAEIGGYCKFKENCKAAYSDCVHRRCTCKEGFTEIADRGICGTSTFYCPNPAGQMPDVISQFETCMAPSSGTYSNSRCSNNEFCYFHTYKISPSKYYQGRCCPKLNPTSDVKFAVCPMTHPTGKRCASCNYDEQCSENFGLRNVPVSCCPDPCPRKRKAVNIEYKCYILAQPGKECITDVQCAYEHSFCNSSTKTCQCEDNYYYDKDNGACNIKK